MPVNEQLIRQTIAAIENDLDHWDQKGFVMPWGGTGSDPLSCGTTMCFAGWAVRIHKGDESFIADTFERDTTGRWAVPDGAYYSIEGIAAELLGLGAVAFDQIFYCLTDDVEVLKARITEITGITFDEEPSDG